MLSYRVFEKFARMLLEGFVPGCEATEMPLPTLFGQVRDEAFRPDGADPGRTSMAGLSMRMFTFWRTRLRVIDGGAAPTEEDLHDVSWTEWADAMYTIYWHCPRIDHLHLECVAVALAYCNMVAGSRAIIHAQELTSARQLTGRIDRATVYAIMRAAKTREQGRALAARLLEWCGADDGRISAYLLRLDLAEDEE